MTFLITMSMLLSVICLFPTLSAYRNYGTSRTFSMVSNSFFNGLLGNRPKGLTVDELSGIKNNIKSISKGNQNGIKCNPSQRQKVNEYVAKLEANNPTKDITSSTILNGKWKLVYTTNEGSSAGKIGPFVGDVYQMIDLNKKFYSNKVSLFNDIFTGVLGATWITKSKALWTVQFQDIVLKLAGIKLVKKSLSGTEGTWRNTYLDANFRILYAIGGKNTVKENIYILEKLNV